ncbi:hypothetical protein AND_007528 [Anopheles darlingi]|uniref:Uncharacterized protein n=1 Tax=Anopheles darlingi TaxID=43151 RepID=W5J8R1_ANODA|nr:uncharacterized protein LOC125952729 [Anopheles darlingi]ETN60847.1 hypothetical protein AND_007528 [Anopheles darlingi]
MEDAETLNHWFKERRYLQEMEKTLHSMIEKINQQLNQRMVEELDLKSRDAQVTVGVNPSNEPVETEPGAGPSEINKQQLDLTVNNKTCFNLLWEEEDDEED